MTDDSVSSVVERPRAVLEDAGTSYAFGGAVALAAWSEPRATAWVHSAEVLAVFKMLFFRPKDLVDVERMLTVQGERFDRAFVRDALVDMLGEDERISKWDELCERADRA